ncbi:hypothetical protein [Weissella halotolerans]|uniref:Uncharacterized protein n=1 Tax=Weissella halotolerans DSM 20190 TaxID=1123500 RepID=A0A0R2FYD4_9LACO|nr:hypothetical protein [Weissella halotolerans]KRN33471.1 hypothetical protein IV68_GL000273 [Weissella halotolerans DSM 20190]
MKKTWWKYGLVMVVLVGLGLSLGWQLGSHQQESAKEQKQAEQTTSSKAEKQKDKKATQEDKGQSASEPEQTKASSELSATESDNAVSSSSQTAVIQNGQAAADLIEQADRNRGADTSQVLYDGYARQDGTFGVNVRSKAMVQQGGSGTVDIYIVYPDGSYEHAPAYR